MATAFTQRERERIYQSLQDAALRCAVTVGMRHATVDELAHEVGISKGTFYRFYESKEHLFLSMLERMHNEMYGGAERVLIERTDLPVRERTMLAIYEVCKVAERREAFNFLREDVPLLLRRLPEALLREHYMSDDERIRKLILKADVKLRTSLETACTVVRLLLMTLSFKRSVDGPFDEAMRLMIEGACDRLLA